MHHHHLELHLGNSQFNFPFDRLSSSRNGIPKLPRIHTLISKMATQPGSGKRPTCPSCSKPTSICLCNRLRTPILHNSVAVTILQHKLEKKHPLNSTRIATIGLKNVDIFTVSDVNFQARFSVRLQDSSCGVGGVEFDEARHLFDEMPTRDNNDELVGTTILRNNSDSEALVKEGIEAKRRQVCKNFTNLSGSQFTAINFTIEKNGAITSFNNSTIDPQSSEEMSFDRLLASDIGIDEIRKGFVVKKLERKDEYSESEEFEIGVPAGSVLLFPGERSVNAESIDFEVKNLIVLDGTWAKAKRMYSENPWLRAVPQVKLDVEKVSLYGEVRRQPRAGYLSTIESIVYAMKALGEDCEGLDGLLDVFESMVGDQRRCQQLRLSKVFHK